jgi:hypothetical protein
MPDVSLVVHAVEILGSDKSVLRRRGAPQNGTLNDLLMLGTYFVHSSVMYRKSRKFKHVGTDEIVDFYFHVEHASTGNVYFDDGVLGCYRVHEGGISKNLKHREMLEKCYETAFDRALELGAVAQVVAAARMKRRMAFAIARCLAGDLAGYKEKIRLSQADAKYASLKHRLLHFSRFVPLLVTVYMWSKKLGMNA